MGAGRLGPLALLGPGSPRFLNVERHTFWAAIATSACHRAYARRDQESRG